MLQESAQADPSTISRRTSAPPAANKTIALSETISAAALSQPAGSLLLTPAAVLPAVSSVLTQRQPSPSREAASLQPVPPLSDDDASNWAAAQLGPLFADSSGVLPPPVADPEALWEAAAKHIAEARAAGLLPPQSPSPPPTPPLFGLVAHTADAAAVSKLLTIAERRGMPAEAKEPELIVAVREASPVAPPLPILTHGRPAAAEQSPNPRPPQLSASSGSSSAAAALQASPLLAAATGQRPTTSAASFGTPEAEDREGSGAADAGSQSARRGRKRGWPPKVQPPQTFVSDCEDAGFIPLKKCAPFFVSFSEQVCDVLALGVWHVPCTQKGPNMFSPHNLIQGNCLLQERRGTEVRILVAALRPDRCCHSSYNSCSSPMKGDSHAERHL